MIQQKVSVNASRVTGGPGLYTVVTPGVTITLEDWNGWDAGPDNSITVKDMTGAASPAITIVPTGPGAAIDGQPQASITAPYQATRFIPLVGGTTWVVDSISLPSSQGAPGPAGPTGPTGPPGPNAVSGNAGNAAILGTDNLIFVPPGGGAPPSNAAPQMDGTAAAGSSALYARGDHVHPTDTSRYAASNPSGYVNAAGAAAAAPVQSVATRTGAVTLTHADLTDWTASLAPYAPLASPTFTGVVTIPSGALIAGYLPLTGGVLTANLSFNPTTAGVSGTTAANNAAAGTVGEYIVSTVASPGVSLTTAVSNNVGSISLTAGDWDVDGVVAVSPSATVTACNIWVNNVSATSPTTTHGINGDVFSNIAFTFLWSGPTGTRRFSLGATTTIYLSAQASFASGTCTAYGEIRARRVR